MILSYTRNKHATTIDLDNGDVLTRTSVEDTFFAAAIEIVIKVPDLEMTSIKGEIKRAFHEECQQAIPLLQKMVGLRVGTGIIKSVNSLVGGKKGCPRLADLILECCDQVILRFTAPSLREVVSKTGEQYIEAQLELVKGNPRLIDSCIVFKEGSPLRERARERLGI